MAGAGPSLFDDDFQGEVARGSKGAVHGSLPKSQLEQWTSLSACVLDAVWSVGASHDQVVVPLVHRVLEPAVTGPLASESVPGIDTHPLPRLLTRFPDDEALQQAAQNRQRTSTRNGITKADAALRFARILVGHGVLGLEDLPRLLADQEAWSRVDRALSRTPGEGQQGARRTHFWVLCGVRENAKFRVSLL